MANIGVYLFWGANWGIDWTPEYRYPTYLGTYGYPVRRIPHVSLFLRGRSPWGYCFLLFLFAFLLILFHSLYLFFLLLVSCLFTTLPLYSWNDGWTILIVIWKENSCNLSFWSFCNLRCFYIGTIPGTYLFPVFGLLVSFVFNCCWPRIYSIYLGT
jgi:hypothetical protein